MKKHSVVVQKSSGPGRVPLPKKTGGHHGAKRGRGSYNRRPKHKSERHDSQDRGAFLYFICILSVKILIFVFRVYLY